MSLRGYKPKTRKAPWVEAAGITEQLKPRKYIARVSKRRKERGEIQKYPEFARRVVREDRAGGRRCPVSVVNGVFNGMAYGYPISTKIRHCHHVCGRGPNDELLLLRMACVGLSTHGHRWVHAHINEARAKGWYAPEGLWNNPKAVFALAESCRTPEEFRARLIERHRLLTAQSACA